MNQPTKLRSGSLRSLIFKALLWQGTGQIGERVFRFLSNIVLARLLLPHDFGIAGMVAAGLAAIDSAMFIASNQAILQSDRGRNREFLDTAFLLAVGRGLIIGLILLVIAPLLSEFFCQPQAASMFALLAFQPVISGLASPRSWLLVKDLRFGVWSIYQAGSNVLGLIVTILLAVGLRSAWALVLGQILTQMFVSIGSYIVAPYRPRWCFDSESWHELRTFGLRASGYSLIVMLIMQSPALLAGRSLGMAALGVFLLNQRLAYMPQNLFMRAISTVALPAYSTIKNDSEYRATLWLKALRTITLLTLPVGATFIWVDRALPAILYGQHFATSSGLFALLVVDGTLSSIGVVTGPLFWAMGLPCLDRNIQLVRLIVLYVVSLALLPKYGLLALGVGFAVSAVISQVLVLGCGRRINLVRWRDIFGSLMPGTFLAGGVMIILLWLNKVFAFTTGHTVIAGGIILILSIASALAYVWRENRIVGR